MTWEYQAITLRAEQKDVGEYGIGESHVRTLDGLGSEGWELVAMFPNKHDDVLRDVTYVLKRPRKQSSALK